MKQWTNIEALNAVRELPGRIRDAKEDIEMLRSAANMVPELAESVRNLESEVKQNQLQFTAASIQAMRAIGEVSDRDERAVMWRYYMLRESNREVAKNMHMDKSSVLRHKRSAIQQLKNEGREET